MVDQKGRALRTDIQGLRAVAVLTVVVYHLHAAALPGGFVGVDVFFVISGFLITSHLVARPPASGAALAGFWGRRIRRLLPAALLVLAATLLAVRLFSPETIWQATASDARAATLYVVNWALAGQAVDYLAADNAPTAVQHFWSLSVEEQFYFGWPLLVAGVALLARRRGASLRTALALAFGLVVAASFAWSVHLTTTNPAAAYFVTPTRIWELGAGGLLAVLVPGAVAGRRAAERARGPLLAVGAWAGLALIAYAALRYTSATPFPGYQAALPVLGAVLLIGCGAPATDRRSPGPLLALRPVRWLGDVSYSVYLWHWPLIVVATSRSGHELGPRGVVAVLALALVLAALTERYVERPFRSPATPDARRTLRRTYGVAVAAMAVVVGLATVQLTEVDRRAEESARQVAAALEKGGPCFGAAAVGGKECPTIPYAQLVPAAQVAADDRSEAYNDISGGKSCWSGPPAFESVECTFGDPDAEVTIALFGNSHAGQWLPALQSLADDHGWRIETHLASRCAATDVPQQIDQAGGTEACQAWVRRTADALVAQKPDLVVVSNRTQAAVVGLAPTDRKGSQAPYTEGYVRVLGGIADAGVPVLAIRDTPIPGKDIPECVAAAGDDYADCDGSRKRWLRPDPVIEAIAAVDDPRFTLTDLTDRFCGPDECRAVNGGVITYFDENHVTATYIHTLAPFLEPAVLASLRQRRAG